MGAINSWPKSMPHITIRQLPMAWTGLDLHRKSVVWSGQLGPYAHESPTTRSICVVAQRSTTALTSVDNQFSGIGRVEEMLKP